jgi:hypothetical protein
VPGTVNEQRGTAARVPAPPLIINLADPPSPAGPRRGASRRRARLPAAILTALLLVAAAAAWALTYRSGLAWREQAAAQERRADLVTARLTTAQTALDASRVRLTDTAAVLNTTQRRLADTEQRLGAAEADAAQLEERMAALAGEKARVEDARVFAEQERDASGATAAAAAEVGDRLVACVDGLYGWLASVPSERAGPAAWASWSRDADAVAVSCERAQSAHDALRRTLGG